MKVTLFLIALNLIAFGINLTNPDYFINTFGFSSTNFFSGNYYVIITSMFLHASLLHLAGNMIALLFLGLAIEKKSKSWQYLLVYFFSGIVGNLSMIIPLFGYSPYTIGVGASAAISGLVGLGIFMCPGKFVFFPSIIPIPFALAGAIYLITTVSNLFAPGYVAYSAHLFGFLGGAFIGAKWSENIVKRLLVFVALLLLIVFLPTIISIVFALAL